MAVGTLVRVLTWVRYATGSRPGSGESPDRRQRPRGRSDRWAIEALDITAPYGGPPPLSAVLRPGHCIVMHPITTSSRAGHGQRCPGRTTGKAAEVGISALTEICATRESAAQDYGRRRTSRRAACYR